MHYFASEMKLFESDFDEETELLTVAVAIKAIARYS